MYEFIIGCDMSKSTFDASYYNDSKAVYLNQFENSTGGFKSLLKALGKMSIADQKDWLIVFENTGVYSKELKYYLIKNGIPCVEEIS